MLPTNGKESPSLKEDSLKVFKFPNGFLPHSTAPR